MSAGLLAMVAAALGFITIAGFGMAFAGEADNEKLARRAKMIAREQRDADRARLSRGAANDPGARRRQLLQTLKDADKKQRKATLSLNAKILQAGISLNPRTFWIISALLGIIVAGAGLVLRAPPLLAVGLGFAAGFGLPRWVLGFLGKRRLKKFTEDFPNAIDIIVRGIKSGIPVHDCLKIIARESPEPLGSEFQRLVESIGMGMSVEQSLEKAYERMPTAELRFFTIVLAIQAKTGGNLAEALGNLSGVLRSRKLMREKIKAMSSEAVASAGIIGILPPGVMILVTIMTPAYMMVMFTDPRGHMMLAGSVVWMSIGGFIMKRMINFKF